MWPLAWVASSAVQWSRAFVQRLPTGSPPKPLPVHQFWPPARVLRRIRRLALTLPIGAPHRRQHRECVRQRCSVRRSKMPSMLLGHIVQQIGAPIRPCALATMTVASIRLPRGWAHQGDERLRRDHQLLHEQLLKQNWDLREAHEKPR